MYGVTYAFRWIIYGLSIDSIWIYIYGLYQIIADFHGIFWIYRDSMGYYSGLEQGIGILYRRQSYKK